MIKQRTFAQLDQEAMSITFDDPARDGVNYVIAHAEDNMPDEEGRLESILCILSFSREMVNTATLDWFAKRGLKP